MVFDALKGEENFMSSVQLLDKTRKINKLLHNSSSQKIDFNELSLVMGDVLDSNVLIINKRGRLLGFRYKPDIEIIGGLVNYGNDETVDPLFNERILNVLSTKENVNLQILGFMESICKKYYATITPVDVAGKRLGTIFMYKMKVPYDIEDIILCEYGATVVGLEMMRTYDEESQEDSRRYRVVKGAFNSLSSSELEAITYVLDEFKDDKEGMLIASKLADREGITRSVLVNAIKKFQSAGILVSRSSGMRGTHIKIINDLVFDELERVRNI